MLGLQQKDEDSATATGRILGGLPREGYALSIIIPVYNESEILASVITSIVHDFEVFPFNVEFIISENGSIDETYSRAEEMTAAHLHVRLTSIEQPSYGEAIKTAVRRASGEIVVIFNADLWCKRFAMDAVLLLSTGTDIVVGSKRLAAGYDHRPWLRRFITAAFNCFLKYAFGFRGTDTHGMKALRRSRVIPVIERCHTSKEVFDTELVLKAERAGLVIRELPMEVRDSRPPRLSLLRRVPSTLQDLWTIACTL